MKTAIITGGSSGIGKAFTKLLLMEGYRTIVTVRNEQKADRLRRELYAEASKGELEIVTGDFNCKEDVDRLCIYFATQSIDIFINNAGFGLTGEFDDLEFSSQEEMIQVNITTLTQFCYAIIPRMKREKKGRIINIASVAAYTPNVYSVVYGATKSYVLSFSHSLAGELKSYGISVTAVCPGPTNSLFAKKSGMGNTKVFDGKIMSSEKVAELGLRAAKKRKYHIVTGSSNKVEVFGSKFLPLALLLPISKRYLSRNK